MPVRFVNCWATMGTPVTLFLKSPASTVKLLERHSFISDWEVILKVTFNITHYWLSGLRIWRCSLLWLRLLLWCECDPLSGNLCMPQTEPKKKHSKKVSHGDCWKCILNSYDSTSLPYTMGINVCIIVNQASVKEAWKWAAAHTAWIHVWAALKIESWLT